MEWIGAYIRARGKPPTVREIGAHFGITVASVFSLITALERKGYLTRSDGLSRCIALTAKAGGGRGNTVQVPLLGQSAAGWPAPAGADLEGTIPVDRRLAAGRRLFALRVRGDSMVGAGLLDADIVIAASQETAREGDIVVALIEGERTVKRFHRRRDGTAELRAENRAYRPTATGGPPFAIQGRAVAVYRELSSIPTEDGRSFVVATGLRPLMRLATLPGPAQHHLQQWCLWQIRC